MRRWLLAITLFPFVLCSCTIKTGYQMCSDLNVEPGLKDGFFSYWEGEARTRKLCHDYVDVAISASYNIGNKTEDISHIDDISVAVDYWDIRVSARLYPLNSKITCIEPYIGAGIGYYRFNVEIESVGAYSHSDWLFDYYNINENRDTLASGVFPFASVGFYLPIVKNDQLSLQFEYRNDFSKKGNGFDLSGYQLLVGVGWRW